MDPIFLYGTPLGSATGLVAAFEAVGAPYRLCHVRMPDDMVSEAYGRINPRRETPVLVTDDGPLTETMAIALWLEQRDSGRLVSFAPGAADADRLHQTVAFINTTVTGAFGPLWVALERGLDGAEGEMLRALGRADVAKAFGHLDRMVAGDFLMGDRPTIADCVLAGIAPWAAFHGALEPGRLPRLEALLARLDAWEPVAFARAVEAGARPAGGPGYRGEVPLAEVLATAAEAA